MIFISSISSLEHEKKKIMEDMAEEEIGKYIENLTVKLYDSFDSSDVGSMEKYHDLISEAIDILSKKFDLEGYVVSVDRKIANQYMVYYKTRLELINIVGNVRELLNVYSNLSEDYGLLKDLVQFIYNLFIEFSIYNEVDVVESVFSNENVQLLQFNKMVKALKCKIESELAELNNIYVNFEGLDIPSVIGNYENAYNDIDSKYELLKEKGILKEIELSNKLLELVSFMLNHQDMKEVIKEVEDYISSEDVLDNVVDVTYNLKECKLIIG